MVKCSTALQIPPRTDPGRMGILHRTSRKASPILKADASTRTQRNVHAVAGEASRNRPLLRQSRCLPQRLPLLPPLTPATRRNGPARSGDPTGFAVEDARVSNLADVAPAVSALPSGSLTTSIGKCRGMNPNTSGASLYAALDLGTNNCRLLVASPTRPGQFRVVDAFSRIVRLGEGLGATGRLSANAMSRAIEALKICRDKLDNHDVRKARLIATEACRQAQNGAGVSWPG